MYKLFLVLEQHKVDVLCLQETWLTQTAITPSIGGYTLLEHRRPARARGGMAIYVRKGLRVITSKSNEFAMWV